jgi:MFS family permease
MSLPAAARRAGLIPVLPAAAWLVLGGDFVSAVGSGLTLPFLLVYLHQVRHLGYAPAGLVLATVALASVAGNPVGGALADRWGPVRALRLGLAAAAAGSAGIAGVRTAPEAFAAAAVVGFGVAIAWPAQDTLLATLVDPATRSAVFSVRYATMNAGLGLGALVAAAIVTLSHPGTFEAIYLLDAASFLAYIPVLSAVRVPRGPAPDDTVTDGTVTDGTAGPGLAAIRYRDVLRDKAFRYVWALTALIVTVSYGQQNAAFPGYATRPGHITARELSLAFAANTLTVVLAQPLALRFLRGHRRTTGVALAAAAWALSWALVLGGSQLGRGTGAVVAFAAAMVVFAVGESLLAPTLAVIVNDLAPEQARGRYNGIAVLAYTTGFFVGPAAAGAALGAGRGNELFAGLIAVCALAALAGLQLARHLPPAVNRIDAP